MPLPRLPVFAALLLIGAGCARHREPVAAVAAPSPPVELTVAPPPVSPINRALSPAATVWHLRVALNVAALACRGGAEAQIVADYNGLLRGRATELSAVQRTLASEFKARGGDWQDSYDDAMTRLYNFFSQAQVRDDFCRTAAGVLAEARTLPAAELPAFAQGKLPLLDAPFARMMQPAPTPAPATVLAVAARAPVLAAAVAPQAAAPRLRVDVAQLGE